MATHQLEHNQLIDCCWFGWKQLFIIIELILELIFEQFGTGYFDHHHQLTANRGP
jgi:hypothetical protein